VNVYKLNVNNVLIFCPLRAAFEFGPGDGSRGVTNFNIRLPYINGDILKIILHYIYLRQIDLDCANAWKILLAADFLQMTELIDSCRTFMKKNLSLPQCTKIFEMTQS
jgi:BTB/POZ domain